MWHRFLQLPFNCSLHHSWHTHVIRCVSLHAATGCSFGGDYPLHIPQSLRQLTVSQGYSNITPAYLQARDLLWTQRQAPELVFMPEMGHMCTG